jgi:osmotically-inducible protein OsmY
MMRQTLPRSSPVDLDLTRRIEESLAAVGRSDLTGLRVESVDGVVTLAGAVSCWYARQLAVSCVMRDASVVRVNDEIRIVRK